MQREIQEFIRATEALVPILRDTESTEHTDWYRVSLLETIIDSAGLASDFLADSYTPIKGPDSLLRPGYPDAREFAIAAHGSQTYGDKPYVYHLDAVASIVCGLGEPYVTLAYLHDVLEDTDTTKADLAEAFGEGMACAVDLITDPPTGSRKSRKKVINDRLELVGELAWDWPALVVKVADRLANVREASKTGNARKLQMYATEHDAFWFATGRLPLWPWLSEASELLEEFENE